MLKMRVYIAAPIVGITEEVSEKVNNVKNILNNLESTWEIVLHDPSKQKVPNARWMTMQEWAKCVFTLDVIAINSSDWVVVCDFGRDGTAGTARECGYAFAKNKNVLIIYMHDNERDYSLMMHGCSANFCKYTEFISTSPNEVINKFFYQRWRLKSDNIFN